MAMQLSPEEIGRFLEVIGVSLEDCKKLDKAACLKRIITAFSHNIPFTNINLLMIPKDQRRTPSWDTIKENIMSRRGGLCYELHSFMSALLAGLGFHTYCGLARIANDKYGRHVILIVKDLKEEGDTFLVDVGLGRPSFDAFNLDFEVESPCYQHCNVLCKYAKVGDHYVRRQFVSKTDPYFKVTESSQWMDFYTFDLDAISLNEYTAPWFNETAFLYRKGSPLHHLAFAVICPPGLSFELKETSNGIIVYEGTSGETAYRKRNVNSVAELKTVVEQYFPSFSWSDLECILSNGLKFLVKSRL